MKISKGWLVVLCGVLGLSGALATPCSAHNAKTHVSHARVTKSRNTLAKIIALYNSLTPKQIKRDAAKMRKRLPTGGRPITTDLANELELRVLLGSFKQSHISPKNSPHLFETLAKMRDAHRHSAPKQRTFFQYSAEELAEADQRLPLNAVLSLGRVSPSAVNSKAVMRRAATGEVTYSAAGLSSIPEGTLHSSIFLQLYDPATNQPIGQPAYVEQNDGGTNLSLPVSAAGSSSLSEIGVTMIVFYQPKPSASNGATAKSATLGDPPPVSQMLQQTAGIMPVQPPSITAPVHVKTAEGSDFIKVCLSRNSTPDANCDYGPFENPTANPIVQLPVSGTVPYDAAKYSFDSSRKTTGSLYVWAKSGGGACTLTLDPAQFAAAFSAGTAPGQVKWAFNNANFGRLGNNPCWIADQLFGMSLQANVPLTGTPVPGSLYVSTVKFPNPPLDTAFVNSPLDFTWGCFAGGTMIRMADGSSKPVEKIVAGDKILADASGRTLTVRYTIKGTEAKPMYRFTTANGKSVFVTGLHPMVIERSGKRMVVTAKEVREKDLLITVVNNDRTEKASAQTRVEKPSSGKVYNLVLGVKGEPVSKDNTTLIANGILTGDNSMQKEFGMAFKRPMSAKTRAMLEPWLQDARLQHSKH